METEKINDISEKLADAVFDHCNDAIIGVEEAAAKTNHKTQTTTAANDLEPTAMENDNKRSEPDVPVSDVVSSLMDKLDAQKTLIEPYNDCSGADWTLIVTEIIQRSKLQLKVLESKLTELATDMTHKTSLRSWLSDLRSHSHLAMVTYLGYPSVIGASSWNIN